LGSWLCQGRGGEEEDWEKGFAFHLRAAEKFGMPQAAFNVGTHFFSGRGVEQDMGKAAVFFARAAGAGMTQGMINLGNMYLEGLVPRGLEGVESVGEGVAAAKVWYRRAAEAGDPEGRACFAKCEALDQEKEQEKEKGGGV
jgi:TPR repeat protein